MPYVKNLKPILGSRPTLLTIKAHTTFGQIFSKILKSKNIDFVLVQKPNNRQMSAVLLTKIIGKKFFWIQKFQNPPTLTFFGKLLISQADKILTQSRRELNRLAREGVAKSKIRVQK